MPIKHWFYTIFPALRQPFHRKLYEYISEHDKQAQILVMNHGYVSLDRHAKSTGLENDAHCYPLQLYHHVASGTNNWAGAKVLEIGSGRGGGARFLKQHFQPKSVVGVDITAGAVDFCCRHYAVEGLVFAQGDAQLLPFPDNAFDIVVNVESSGYYPDVQRFLQQVVRVLKPGGYFLYTDMRYYEDIDTWHALLAQTGLLLIKEEDITPNVLQALTLDQERRRTLVHQNTPKILYWLFNIFAGLEGADLAQGQPQPGERVYVNFVFRKDTLGQ
jgi:ubiquinone/menaquinone biosynthesis C-methylase UbiE